MADRLQLRRDTAAQWEAVNPILRLCEIGLVIDGAGQVTGMKIGDGRVWNALPLIPIAEKVSASMIADGAVTSDKIAKGVLPTRVSQLTNDIGYLTEAFAENLILNGRFANNAEKWEGDGYEEVDNVHYRSVSGVRVTGEIVQNVDIEEGVYTLSFRYSSESTTPNYVYIDGDVDNITSNFSSEDSNELELPNTVNLSGNYLTITFNVYGGDIAVGFYTDDGSFTLSEVKLEKSKKASIFSLNTRDIADVYGLQITEGGSGSVAISGMLNLNNLTEVKAAQNGLKENEARFFVITDSQGKIPSKQKCYDVPSEVVRQMSLTTGNSIVDLALGSVEVEPIGVSVGDLIALTKVSVKLSDLAAAVGVTISLSGSMLINQYKILHTNGAREEGFVSDDGSTCTKGAYGLLSPWNKQLIEGSSKPTRWAWGTNLDELLQSGVLAYTSADIEGVAYNWTIFVDCSASPDGSGFYHLVQTAIGRDDANLGDVYMRLGHYQKGAAPAFLPWKKLSV